MNETGAKRITDVPPRIVLVRQSSPAEDGGGSSSAASQSTDAMGDWLRVLGKLLKLPEAHRLAIMQELDSHIRDRARDLMLNGENEAKAVQTAIEELGDAADLAQRFASAHHTPRRRLMMNIGVFGMAGVALVTSFVALNGGSVPVHAPRAALYEPSPTSTAPQEPEAPARVGTLELKDARLDEAFEYLAESQRTVSRAYWAALEQHGFSPDTRVSVKLRNSDLTTAISVMNDATGGGRHGASLDYRLSDGVLEVAPRAYFDRRESVLMSYDIRDLHEQSIEDEKLTKLVQDLVEPEQWKDNGGEVASLHVLGERLFAKAPPRMQKMVGWVIEELAAGVQRQTADQPARSVPYLSNIPIFGNLSKLEPGARVSEGASIAHVVTVSIPLRHVAAAEMRDVLGVVLNVDPILKTCRVERSLVVDERSNTLFVVATSDQVGPIEQIVRHLDQDQPIGDTARSTRKSFKLTRLRPEGVREVLAKWFDACPGLKQCLVTRIMEVDSEDQTLTVTTTPGQLLCIEKVISILDNPVGGEGSGRR